MGCSWGVMRWGEGEGGWDAVGGGMRWGEGEGGWDAVGGGMGWGEGVGGWDADGVAVGMDKETSQADMLVLKTTENKIK